MSEQLRSAMVRIHDRRGSVVGAGFLVTDREILTCAHVVAQALGILENTPEQPVGEIQVDFPLIARGTLLTAKVILWRPVGAIPKEEEDIAVLKLEQGVSVGAQAVRLVRSEELWGHAFRTLGFPVGYDQGVWASGRLLEREATGWVQIEDVKASGFRVQSGFSGGPVWDEQLNGVAGMIVAAEQRPEIKAAFMIPVDLLVKVWPALDERTIPPCPYRGLFAFREEDAPFFFGREAFTEQLVEVTQKKSLTAVIGSSGSGKSSVVFAGLLPHLRQIPFQEGRINSPPLPVRCTQTGGRGQGWVIAHFRPGKEPFRTLAAALVPFLEPQMSETDRLVEIRKLGERLRQRDLSLHEVTERILQKSQNAGSVLLFADQFEELYTLCPESEIRRQFLDELLEVRSQARSEAKCRSSGTPLRSVPDYKHHKLILTMRADFMEQALAYRPFADALQDNILTLGPMTREELQRAIEHPAQKLNVMIETGLVERILDDVENEPGSLPLLEFALTLLWERQVIGKLTHEAYEAIGQVKGALARHADEVYNDLSDIEQQRLRKVFVQMVRPGEGTEDTRRLASRVELDQEQWTLVQRMTNNRLVITDRDPAGEETVEVVHESLIRGWGRLRQWMKEDRSFRTWQEGLRAALRQWEANQHDEGGLLRGAPLAVAKDWLTEREADLSEVEQQFIRKSLELREREEVEKERQRQRELENARKIKYLALGLAVFLVIAVGAALFAWYQQGEAERRSFISTAQSLIAYAFLDNVEGDRERAALLARQAYFLNQRYKGDEDDVSGQIDDALRTILHPPKAEQSPDLDTLVEQVCQKVKYKLSVTQEEWEKVVGREFPHKPKPCFEGREPDETAGLHLRSKEMETDDGLALSLNLYQDGIYWYPKRHVDRDVKNRFDVQREGKVIVDRVTGLMWQQSGSDEELTYAEAQAYVKTLNQGEGFAGYTDWRLPTIPELMSLLESERQSNKLYINPIFDSRQIWVWSSDIYRIKGESSAGPAWFVNFYYGYVYWYTLIYEGYVRCVRS